MTKDQHQLMELARVFRSFDTDGDGKISAEELAHRVTAIDGELSPDDAMWLLSSLDSDGDGLLDMDDFIKLAEWPSSSPSPSEEEDQRNRDLRAAFEMFRNDNEGRCITAKSLSRMLSRVGMPRSIDDCHAMIVRFDLDGDGVLSFDEFRIMMRAYN